MSNFVFKEQFSCRIPKPELAWLNENIHHLIPDSNSEKLENRDVFLHLCETSMSKKAAAHHPDDLQKIKELQSELDEYKALQIVNNRNAEELTAKIEVLENEAENDQGFVDSLLVTIDELKAEREELRKKILSVEKANKVIIDLSPAQFEVTEIFREKLSELAKQEITTAQMLFDLFWKYITKQATQIAFPFFLSPREIKKILAKHQNDSE